MKYDIDLFCWEVPESKKYLQKDRGIQFERGGRGGWLVLVLMYVN